MQGACVYFGAVEVIRNLTLRIEPGENIAIIGPSGAGKTTFLRLLNGTVLPTSGRVLSDSVDSAELGPTHLRRLRSRVGFVHQEHALVPNVRVVQNVVAGKLGQRSMWGAVRSMLSPTRTDLDLAHELLVRVGIGDKLFQRTDHLSGGERQRVALARALFQEPDALLADEPVASVDPARARDLIGLLCEVARERGLTLVCSLHDLLLAQEFFGRSIGLREGRVQFDGATNEIPAEAFDDLYRLEDAGSRAR